MKIENGKLMLHNVDIDHIIGWFEDGDSLKQAIERELYLHGYGGGGWTVDADKIYKEKP